MMMMMMNDDDQRQLKVIVDFETTFDLIPTAASAAAGWSRSSSPQVARRFQARSAP